MVQLVSESCDHTELQGRQGNLTWEPTHCAEGASEQLGTPSPGAVVSKEERVPPGGPLRGLVRRKL